MSSVQIIGHLMFFGGTVGMGYFCGYKVVPWYALISVGEVLAFHVR